MEHHLMDLVEEICRECGGQCCSDFCVYAKRRDGRIHRNRVYGAGKSNLIIRKGRKAHSQIIRREGRDDWLTPCYYWIQGGCPPDKKAEDCKLWVCSIIEAVIYMGEIPDWSGKKPSQAGIEVYKQLRRYR